MVVYHLRKHTTSMNSLHPLTDRNFLVEEGGKYYGNIPPDKEYKRCSAVIFQEFCLTTKLGYDIMISWLQKAIRRGMLQDAQYVAVHLAEMRGIFLSNLLNRLMVILSEDIGPAEPTITEQVYPLYQKIKEDRPSTGALRDNETISSDQKRAILEIVYKLAMSRKSRIADWQIHSATSDNATDSASSACDEDGDDVYDWQPLNDLLDDFVQVCQDADINGSNSQSEERCSEAMRMVCQILAIKEKLPWGTCLDPARRRPIWLVWQLLEQMCPPNLTAEIIALKELYSIRDDLLHLSHAVCLIVYQHDIPSSRTLKMPNVPCDQEWDHNLTNRRPVLNDAIDKHTREGRNLLGRDMVFFLERGVHLENHHPFPGEAEILAQMLQEEREKEESFAEKKPRPYQIPIIDATKKYFEEETEGVLQMACGTGKTLTSFWITHSFMQQRQQCLRSVVVTPRLQVLGQFYRTYRDSFIQHKVKTVVGVICSDFSKPRTHDMCYHEHIRNQKELVAFWERYIVAPADSHDYEAVVLFTTYSSLKKIRALTEATIDDNNNDSNDSNGNNGGFWDLIVYDEGHHMDKTKHAISTKKSLLLSATPASHQQVIYRYDYKTAINDGALTPYQVHAVPIIESKEEEDSAQAVKDLPRPLCDNLADTPKVQIVSEIDLIAHHLLDAGTFRKLIVFSACNARSKELYDEMREQYPEIPTLYIDHKTKMKDRDPITRTWSTWESGVFFNCSILGEGVDFPSVDAVYLESGHVSPTRVIQAAGRPLRIDPNRKDKRAHILMSYRNRKEYGKMLDRLHHL